MRARVERISGATPSAVIDTAFLSPRRELRGWGRAQVIDVAAPWPAHLHLVTDALDDIDVEQTDASRDVEPGVGPVAFGALPFDVEEPARFVVPSTFTTLTPDGALWRTVIDDSSVHERPTPEPPQVIRVESRTDPAAWLRMVADVVGRIDAGEAVKVVLARRLDVEADPPFDAATLAARMFERQPAALRFAIDGVVGASPELLVSRIGDMVRAHPMAGTTPRSGDPATDSHAAAALLASSKNRAEHQITIDAVHDALLRWCSYLDAEPEPTVAAAGAVQHLATMVEGRLSHPVPSVLDLVAALHPTPAVGGWPRGVALKTISRLEPEGRGRYAGPVGWVDRHGNGAFAVGIRSIELLDDGRRAALHAGVGVVSGSDPLLELEETRAKFRATLPALIDL